MIIGAIVVIYYPKESDLKAMVLSLKEQVDFICLVDNTPDGNSVIDMFSVVNGPWLNYIPMGRNAGIASAQNAGIAFCQQRQCDAVVFFDQDSSPGSQMVPRLLDSLKVLEARGFKVAAVAPRTVSILSGKVQTARIDRGSLVADNITRQRQVISSGSVSKLGVFNTVGTLEDALFIDAVDFEWCWRAIMKGYGCYISEDVRMLHQVGGKEYKFLRFGVSNSSPFRCYYLFRNFILLSVRGYVPIYWKVSNLAKLVFKFFFYSLAGERRWEYFKRMLCGTTDGLLVIMRLKRLKQP